MTDLKQEKIQYIGAKRTRRGLYNGKIYFRDVWNGDFKLITFQSKQFTWDGKIGFTGDGVLLCEEQFERMIVKTIYMGHFVNGLLQGKGHFITHEDTEGFAMFEDGMMVGEVSFRYPIGSGSQVAWVSKGFFQKKAYVSDDGTGLFLRVSPKQRIEGQINRVGRAHGSTITILEKEQKIVEYLHGTVIMEQKAVQQERWLENLTQAQIVDEKYIFIGYAYQGKPVRGTVQFLGHERLVKFEGVISQLAGYTISGLGKLTIMKKGTKPCQLIGEIVNSELEGPGRQINEDGVLLDGFFVRSNLHDKLGKRYTRDSVGVGMFNHGKMEGLFCNIDAYNNILIGFYSFNILKAKKLWITNGSRYEFTSGEEQKGIYSGRQFLADGTEIVGQFTRDGQAHGECWMRKPGYEIKGDWELGTLVKKHEVRVADQHNNYYCFFVSGDENSSYQGFRAELSCIMAGEFTPACVPVGQHQILNYSCLKQEVTFQIGMNPLLNSEESIPLESLFEHFFTKHEEGQERVHDLTYSKNVQRISRFIGHAENFTGIFPNAKSGYVVGFDWLGQEYTATPMAGYGEFVCGLLDGIGTKRFAFGMLETGMFTEGELNGEGKRVYEDGFVQAGEFVAGVFQGPRKPIAEEQFYFQALERIHEPLMQYSHLQASPRLGQTPDVKSSTINTEEFQQFLLEMQ